jgi:hypothetical protein
MNVRAALIAASFFMIGFFVADHMMTAKAEPTSAAQEIHGGSFSGTEGALVVKSGSGSSIFIIRGNKVWKLDPTQSQSLNNKVWGTFE